MTVNREAEAAVGLSTIGGFSRPFHRNPRSTIGGRDVENVSPRMKVNSVSP
ncbi:hypothetical protein [Leptolyngbya sp. FACHB-711]|uniref:hypothetical protein n=1 Tax=Leptolyngbya sp. FACHB-711 TaxID=2692813 RepID=UPI001684E189|nr:hypothetical protein [Leptolyngbya sp. FACHB-711]MBD1852078.1 hypothetical protein [Cyanobacteria bacterium FACHB-502]